MKPRDTFKFSESANYCPFCGSEIEPTGAYRRKNWFPQPEVPHYKCPDCGPVELLGRVLSRNGKPHWEDPEFDVDRPESDLFG